MTKQAINERILTRLNELIAEGEEVLCSVSTHTHSRTFRDLDGKTSSHKDLKTYTLDFRRYEKWKTNCIVLFDGIKANNSSLSDHMNFFNIAQATKPHVLKCIAIIEAFKESFEKGFFDDITIAIRADVTSSYLGQAEELLREGKTGQYAHIPAAVLAGAVLERNLRDLCERQEPPVPTKTHKGEYLTLNPLIDGLKKSGLYNELKAKQLRAWADIRNDAAHGKFDTFTSNDVQQMLAGISTFLADFV